MSKKPDIFDVLKDGSIHLLLWVMVIIVFLAVPFVVYWVIIKLIDGFIDNPLEKQYKIILFIFLAVIYYYYLFLYVFH